MTVPMEYRLASRDFDAFMEELKRVSMLQTTHQAFTMLDGVFRTFRRRLAVSEAIVFAAILPPVLRAIFVSDWDVSQPVVPFQDRAILNGEVRALRHNHNVSSENAIEDVATALSRHVDKAAFDRVLAALPVGARGFWAVETSA